jgi:hypothetical protein
MAGKRMAGKRIRRRSSKNPKSCGMMWGGAGAADHAIAVYGGIGQQQVNPATGAIQENPVGQMGGAPLTPAPVQMGGAPLAPAEFGAVAPIKPMHGGSTGTELAVPAVLLLANQTFSRRRRGSFKKRRGSFRRRRSNRRR